MIEFRAKRNLHVMPGCGHVARRPGTAYPTMSRMAPFHPSSIDLSELRPRRGWYWFAGIIAALGCILGAGIGVGIITEASASGAKPSTRIALDPDGLGTVRLTPNRDWGVFTTAHMAPGRVLERVSCAATSGRHAAEVIFPPGNSDGQYLTFNDAAGTWAHIASLRVPADGMYRVTCRVIIPGTGPARYVVGEAPNAAAVESEVTRGVIVSVVGPLIALIVGGIIAWLVTMQRSAHRQRLLAARRAWMALNDQPGR